MSTPSSPTDAARAEAKPIHGTGEGRSVGRKRPRAQGSVPRTQRGKDEEQALGDEKLFEEFLRRKRAREGNGGKGAKS